jgi:hypothetical protein
MKFVSDHIIARKHGGESVPDNLAYACPQCNSFKLDNIAGLDLPSTDIVRLFNPRHDAWNSHFRWEDGTLVGITSIARATIRVLNINEPQRRLLRAALMAEGVSFD